MLFPNKKFRSIVITRVSNLSQYKDNIFPPYIQIKKHQPFGQCLIKLFYDFSCLISTQFEIVSASDFAVNDIEGWKGVSEEFYNLYYKQGNKGQIQIGWSLPHYIENGVAKIPYKRILIRRK